MFDWLLPEDHAISVIKSDHEKLKGLFEAFNKAENAADRKKIVSEALTVLKLHAAMEEEIFYPAIRSHVGVEKMNEADEEHHVARVLIAEIDAGAADEGHLHAKFTVLSENVRHHIQEEEDQVLSKAREMKIDFEALGLRMISLRGELLRTGIPDDAEHVMVARAGKRDDTPAAASKKRAAGPSASAKRKPAPKHATAKKRKKALAPKKATDGISLKRRAARR
jgi:hypothetical protein